jgi:DNA-binding PadR family transcriptional regulator
MSAVTGPSDPGLLILASLAEGARHGYAITRDVRQSFGVGLGPGTLYGALARLEQRGLIEAVDGDAPRRRPYRLTAVGRSTLAEQVSMMRSVSDRVQARLAVCRG